MNFFEEKNDTLDKVLMTKQTSLATTLISLLNQSFDLIQSQNCDLPFKSEVKNKIQEAIILLQCSGSIDEKQPLTNTNMVPYTVYLN